jgi:peptidoglycan biosynthesis protein MviN/MurJ (putative lipid II flippase)
MEPSSDNVVSGSALSRRLRGVHANHKRIAAGAVTIAALTIVAKALVAAREMAIAWRYGVSGIADSYQLALTIVTWLPMLVTSVLGVVLVPRLVSLHRRPEAREMFVSEFNGAVLALAAVIAVLTYFSAPLAARLMASRLDPETLHLTTTMVERLAPVSLFMIVAGYFTARLQARERFSYTVTEAVPALTIAIFVLAPFPARSVAPLIIGALLGYLGQTLILSRLIATGDPPIGRVAIRHQSEEWATFYGPVLIMALGQFVITATVPIDQAFAARVGPGSVATLGYANRIITLFSSLASVVIGRALLPVLSAAVADGNLVVGRRQAVQWAFLMFFAAVAGSGLLWILAPELVRLLFQRGAFQADATAAVSNLLRYGSLQLPFYFGGIALVQWLAATARFKEILSITIVALTVKLLLNFLLVGRFGLPAIMTSTAVMYFVTSALCVVVSYRPRRSRALGSDAPGTLEQE